MQSGAPSPPAAAHLDGDVVGEAEKRCLPVEAQLPIFGGGVGPAQIRWCTAARRDAQRLTGLRDFTTRRSRGAFEMPAPTPRSSPPMQRRRSRNSSRSPPRRTKAADVPATKRNSTATAPQYTPKWRSWWRRRLAAALCADLVGAAGRRLRAHGAPGRAARRARRVRALRCRGARGRNARGACAARRRARRRRARGFSRLGGWPAFSSSCAHAASRALACAAAGIGPRSTLAAAATAAQPLRRAAATAGWPLALAACALALGVLALVGPTAARYLFPSRSSRSPTRWRRASWVQRCCSRRQRASHS